jgi:uncharacterized protein YndB with AHSA1/START domain
MARIKGAGVEWESSAARCGQSFPAFLFHRHNSPVFSPESKEAHLLLPARTVTGLSYCLALALYATGMARAAAGDPVVHVNTDEKLNAAHIRASIEIAAPPTVVWAVLIDCARMPRIMPNLESCRIVQHDAGGKWDVREHVINWALLLPKLHTVVRNTFDPDRRLRFKSIGGDMRISEGEWKLEPNARGTMLSYNALVAPDFPVPQFLVEQAVNTDMPNLLRAIQKASVEDAEKK